MTPGLVSVVIPAYNAEKHLGEQLGALASQVDGDPFEVIVVDNSSTDRTREVAEEHRGSLDLHVIEAPDVHAAPHARNVGIREARGDFIVFVDADDVVARTFLSAYRRQAARYRIMGGPYEETLLNEPYVREWRPPTTPDGPPLFLGKIPHFQAGNAAIHRSVFHDLGTFDDALTYSGEEPDFCARAILAGYEIGWVPDAVVHYRHRTTLSALARQWFNWGRANTLLHERYREQFSLPPTTLGHTARYLWAVVPHVVDLMRGNHRRGQWVRMASFLAGEAVESLRLRVWHFG